MLRCPYCGSPIQTLDLPCAICASNAQPTDELRHSYTRSFDTRGASRSRPEDFLAQINHWLFHEETLEELSVQMHTNEQGLVRAMTFSCIASSRRKPLAFQFDRVRLAQSTLIVRDPQDIARTLVAWSGAHPGVQRLNNWIVALNGRPLETWVLFASPRVIDAAEMQAETQLPRLE